MINTIFLNRNSQTPETFRTSVRASEQSSLQNLGKIVIVNVKKLPRENPFILRSISFVEFNQVENEFSSADFLDGKR